MQEQSGKPVVRNGIDTKGVRRHDPFGRNCAGRKLGLSSNDRHKSRRHGWPET